MTRDRAGKAAARIVDNGYRRGIAIFDKRRKGLRYESVNSERRLACQRYDRRRRAAGGEENCVLRGGHGRGSRWNQRTRIYKARSYDAVERRPHYFVPLHRKFLFVGCFGLEHRGVSLVAALLRDDLL